MASYRFVTIEDPGAVTVGEAREAETRFHAPFGVVLDQGRPRGMMHFEELPSTAGPDERLSQYLEPLEELELVRGRLAAAQAAEAIAFAPGFAVLVRALVPFVAPADTPLGDVGDVDRLIASGSFMIAAVAQLGHGRLPGKPEPLDPIDRSCLCPRGHRVTVSATNPVTVCSAHGLRLMC